MTQAFLFPVLYFCSFARVKSGYANAAAWGGSGGSAERRAETQRPGDAHIGGDLSFNFLHVLQRLAMLRLFAKVLFHTFFEGFV